MAVTAEELQVLLTAKDAGATNTMTKLTQATTNFGTAAASAGDAVFAGMSMAKMAIVGVGAAAAIGLGIAISKAADFQKEMAVVGAVSGVQGEELQKMGDDAMKMGEKYGTSAIDVAKGLQALGRAGVDSATQMKVLNSAMQMTKMEDMDTQTASENLVNIVKMYGDSLDNVGKYSEGLIHASNISTVSISGLMEALVFSGGAAKTVGWDFKNLMAVYSTLGEQGLRGDIIGTTVRGVLATVLKEGPKTEKGLAAIGLKFDDLKTSAGAVKQPMDLVMTLYNAMSAKFGGMKEHGTQWAAALTKMFTGPGVGEKALRLFTGIEDNKSILQKYTTGMQQSFDVNEKVKESMDSLPKAWDRFTTTVNNLMIKMGEGFLPVLQAIVLGLQGFFSLIEDNQAIVYGLSGALTALAIAGIAVGGAWAAQSIIPAISWGMAQLTGVVSTLTDALFVQTVTLEGEEIAFGGAIASQADFIVAENGTTIATNEATMSLSKAGIAATALGAIVGGVVIGYELGTWAVKTFTDAIQKQNQPIQDAEDGIVSLLDQQYQLQTTLNNTPQGTDAWNKANTDLQGVNTQMDGYIQNLGKAKQAQIAAQSQWGDLAQAIGYTPIGAVDNVVEGGGKSFGQREAANMSSGLGRQDALHGVGTQQTLTDDYIATIYEQFQQGRTDIAKRYDDLRYQNDNLTLTKEQQAAEDSENYKNNLLEQSYYKAMGLSDDQIAKYKQVAQAAEDINPYMAYDKDQTSLNEVQSKLQELQDMLDNTTDPNKKHLIQVEIDTVVKPALDAAQIKSRKDALTRAQDMSKNPANWVGGGGMGAVNNPITALMTGFSSTDNTLTGQGFNLIKQHNDAIAALDAQRATIGEKEYQAKKKEIDASYQLSMGGLFDAGQQTSVETLFKNKEALKTALDDLGHALGSLFSALAKVFGGGKAKDPATNADSAATSVDGFSDAVNNLSDFIVTITPYIVAMAGAIQQVADVLNGSKQAWDNMNNQINMFVYNVQMAIARLTGGALPAVPPGLKNADGSPVTQTPTNTNPTPPTTPVKKTAAQNLVQFSSDANKNDLGGMYKDAVGAIWGSYNSPLTLRKKGDGKKLSGNMSTIVFPQLDPRNLDKIDHALSGNGSKGDTYNVDITCYGSQADAQANARSVKQVFMDIKEKGKV
jgi:TP901 family phage tail tape measure protein